MLQPWKEVFTKAEWERLMLRAIIPKLVEGLRKFEIDPSKYDSFAPFHVNVTEELTAFLLFRQDLTLYKAVIAWMDLIPVEHMSTLFEAEFFPKWSHVLQYWLSTSPNYDEISKWYLFWKQQIPQALLQSDRIKYAQTRFLALEHAHSLGSF